MKAINTTVKSLAVAVTLALSNGNASADVLATAVIEFTEFQIFGVVGGTVTQLDEDTSFNSLDFTSTADADASLLGSSESITTNSSTSIMRTLQLTEPRVMHGQISLRRDRHFLRQRMVPLLPGTPMCRTLRMHFSTIAILVTVAQTLTTA
jgi:hypothetical protein